MPFEAVTWVANIKDVVHEAWDPRTHRPHLFSATLYSTTVLTIHCLGTLGRVGGLGTLTATATATVTAITVTGGLWLASPFFSAPLSDPPQASPPLVFLFFLPLSLSLAFQSSSSIWIPSHDNSIASLLHCITLQLRDLFPNLVALLLLFPVWFLFAHGELRWVWRAVRKLQGGGAMEAMVMQVQLGTTPWRNSSLKDVVIARRSGSAHCLAARAMGSSKSNGTQVSLLTWSPLYGVPLLQVSLCWMINVCMRWNASLSSLH